MKRKRKVMGGVNVRRGARGGAASDRGGRLVCMVCVRIGEWRPDRCQWNAKSQMIEIFEMVCRIVEIVDSRIKLAGCVEYR